MHKTLKSSFFRIKSTISFTIKFSIPFRNQMSFKKHTFNLLKPLVHFILNKISLTQNNINKGVIINKINLLEIFTESFQFNVKEMP